MALAPFQDNAGAGLSLLDTFLQSRVPADLPPGTKPKVLQNFTCLMYVGKLSADMPPHEICDFHALVLEEIDREVTGLLIVQASSFMGVVESSPENVVALLAALQRTYKADTVPIRIVGFTEDVPMRRFSAWTYTTVSLVPEPTVDLDAEPAASLCSNLYRTIIHVGKEIKDSGAPASTQLRERFAQYLPSDERVAALATSDKVTSLSEWMDIYTSPLTLATSAIDSVYPLPARSTY